MGRKKIKNSPDTIISFRLDNEKDADIIKFLSENKGYNRKKIFVLAFRNYFYAISQKNIYTKKTVNDFSGDSLNIKNYKEILDENSNDINLSETISADELLNNLESEMDN